MTLIKYLKNLIVKGIHEDTGLLAVDTDNNNKKPKYPFYSFKFITPIMNIGEGGVLSRDFDKSLNPKFKYDYIEKLELQPKAVVSFNSYDKDVDGSFEVCLKAWEYFRHRSKYYFRDNNVVVVNVGNITDRTVFIGEAYEYRHGFDVEFRILHEIENRIETIEEYSFKKGKGVDL